MMSLYSCAAVFSEVILQPTGKRCPTHGRGLDDEGRCATCRGQELQLLQVVENERNYRGGSWFGSTPKTTNSREYVPIELMPTEFGKKLIENECKATAYSKRKLTMRWLPKRKRGPKPKLEPRAAKARVQQ